MFQKKDDETHDVPTKLSHVQKQQSPISSKTPSKTDTDLSMFDVTSTSPTSSNFLQEFMQLSKSWKVMLGNCNMSDVIVTVIRDNIHIPAHKLVIYVRCKQMFNEIVKTESGQDSIVLNSCGQSACLAFLEYLYCSAIYNMSQLSNSVLNELSALAKKYEFCELLKFIENNKKIVNSRMSDKYDNSVVIRSTKRKLFKEKKCVEESGIDDYGTVKLTGMLGKKISQRQDSVLSNDDDIKTENSLTENESLLDNIYDQTTIMLKDLSPAGFCHNSTGEEIKSAENIIHKNLDMLLSLLQKDDAESLPTHEKDTSLPVVSSPVRIQARLQPPAEYVKRKHYLPDLCNNIGSNDSDYIVDSYSNDEGDGVDKSLNMKLCCKDICKNKLNNENCDYLIQISDDERCDLTQKLNVDKNNDYNLTHNSVVEINKSELRFKLDNDNDNCDLKQNPDDKNEEYDLTQKLNIDENNYYGLTQNVKNRNNITQILNEETNECKLSEDISSDDDDDVVILSSDSETCERNKEGCMDRLNKNKECLSPSKDETNSVTGDNLKNSSVLNKLEPTSNLVSPKSVSASFELDKKDFIDPIWDGFDDLNCNFNDVWQRDSPGTLQKSNNTVTEKPLSITPISGKDTCSNDSDLKVISPNSDTSEKMLLYDMETRSPKFNGFGRKSTESVQNLSFESFFKSKHLNKETHVDNFKTNVKSLLSNFENISPNKNINLLPLEDVHHVSSPAFETLNNTLTLESVLKQNKNCKTFSINNCRFNYSSSSNLSSQSKETSKICSQKSVPVLDTNNSNRHRTIHKIHTVSESSESSDCDGDKNYKTITDFSQSHQVYNVLSAIKTKESGCQMSSVDCMKVLFDDTFEINTTVLLNAEEEARISQVTRNALTQSITPDQLKAITPLKLTQPVTTKVATPPNVGEFTPYTVTASSLSTQIIVSDKVTPKPNYSAMSTPLLKVRM